MNELPIIILELDPPKLRLLWNLLCNCQVASADAETLVAMKRDIQMKIEAHNRSQANQDEESSKESE